MEQHLTGLGHWDMDIMSKDEVEAINNSLEMLSGDEAGEMSLDSEHALYHLPE